MPSASLLPVRGVRLAATAAGIRYPDRDDLALIEVCDDAAVAAVFTRNRFRAAPVVVAERHLAKAQPRCLLVNAGNANAGLGDRGVEDAEACCRKLASLAAVAPSQVLPFSTGVIGERLPVHRITAALPVLLGNLSEQSWRDAARAIMTTDTAEKCASRKLELAGATVALTGIAKGAGMIRPDMATMLAFVATDLRLDVEDAKALLRRACRVSFNAITVDGDTSTNDACVLIATGGSGVDGGGLDDAARGLFAAALNQVLQHLARAIVRDAEGATRLIEIEVARAASEDEARAVAFTVAHSPLVKTACCAGDPNWGRIIAAVGRSPVAGLDLGGVRCSLGGHCIFENGAVAANYDEARAKEVMAHSTFGIRIELGRGVAAATVWTSDLTEDYVRINADYRS